MRTTGRRDWHPPTCTTAARPRPRTVMTVHNLAFQGQFPASMLGTLGLPPHAYALDGVEYYGSIGYLKAGLALADRITTVSPTYAEEIRTPEVGMGLDGLLRHRAGVLQRHPQRHRRRGAGIRRPIRACPCRFDRRRIAARAGNKAALQLRAGLAADPDRAALRGRQQAYLAEGDGSAAFGGARDPDGGRRPARAARRPAKRRSSAASRPLRRARPGAWRRSSATTRRWRIWCRRAPTRCWSRRASSPAVSRSCVRCAMARCRSSPVSAAWPTRWWTRPSWRWPIARATGVQFEPVTGDALRGGIERTLALWRDPGLWNRLQAQAMAMDVSWKRPAQQYAALYRGLVAQAAP